MITDELREWARDNTVQGEVFTTYPVQHPVHGTLESLVAIADRIDAEHQKAEDEWKAEHGQMWLKGYSECHAEMLEGNKTLAADLEKCGWVRLPKDADDVPIHIGDMMETPRGGVFTVTGIMCELGKWTVNGWTPTRLHHHEPTVEDVLRAMLDALDVDVCADPDATIAEYAAKLRLAGDGE